MVAAAAVAKETEESNDMCLYGRPSTHFEDKHKMSLAGCRAAEPEKPTTWLALVVGISLMKVALKLR